MTTPKPDPQVIAAARARRKRRHSRQVLIFGTMVIVLAFTAVMAVGVFTGKIESPLSQGYSTPTPDASEKPPCATPPQIALKPTTMNVLNSTTQPGLARLAADMLAERGYTPGVGGVVDNEKKVTGKANTNYVGTALIRFGPNGVNQAYLVAAQIPDAQLEMDKRVDKSVDVVIGQIFDGLSDQSTITVKENEAITSLPNCRSVDKLVTDPDPTPETPADDGAGDGTDQGDGGEGDGGEGDG